MPNALLRKLEAFASLPDEDRRLVENVISEDQEIPARSDLIREGNNPNVVHVITEGFAVRYKALRSGKRQIVACLIPGDFCDLHTFIAKSMDHTIATLTPSRVTRLSRPVVEEMLARPSLARAMLLSTLIDEATLREWIVNLGQRAARQRIAHLFCEIHARMKVVGLADDNSVAFPMSQTDLADTVGLSLVHTNKSLQVLRAQNLVITGSGTVEIPDLERLRVFCGFQANYLHLGFT